MSNPAFAAPYVVSATLLIAGVIHLLPALGLLGADRLVALYGIACDEPNIVILMRHRAVLFGILGALMLYAAVKPSLQGIALAIGCVSVVSFLALASSVGGYNVHLGRVAAVDWLALACLLVGVTAYALK